MYCLETLPSEKYSQAMRLLGINETMISGTAGRVMNTAQTIIGIDYGLKRIGVAVGNTRHSTPSRWKSSQHRLSKAVFGRLQRSDSEWQANALVLGLPAPSGRHGARHDAGLCGFSCTAIASGTTYRFIGWMSATHPRFCPTKPDKMRAAKPASDDTVGTTARRW